MKRFLPVFAACAIFNFAGCSTPNMTPVQNSVLPESATVMAPVTKAKMARANSAADRSFQAPQGRQMTFTASLTLQVPDAKKAAAETRKLILEEGGYVKSMNNTLLTLAVPVQKGDAFLEKISSMGEVVSLQIQGNDVTEQVADLKIRMENLEKSRKRLLVLMDRTANVRDLTQVERELNRVTTELEQLQAANKDLTNRITYITMSVRFQTVFPVVVAEHPQLPLEWINELGCKLREFVQVQDAEQDLPFCVTLPQKFMFAGGELAVSGSNCVITFREIRNVPVQIRWYGNKYADTAFYKDLVMHALKTRFQGNVSCEECTIDGSPALRFQADTKIGNKEYLYLLAIAADDDEIKLIEARGEKEKLLADLSLDGWKKLLDSVRF